MRKYSAIPSRVLPKCNQLQVSSLLTEFQVETTPGRAVKEREFYLQQIRRPWRIISKTMTPQVGVSGFLLFRVKMNIQKGEFCHGV